MTLLRGAGHSSDVNCWHCDRPAHATCLFCGRAVCRNHVASLPLSDFALLLPQFEFHTAKARLLENGNNGSAEPVFQTYSFPLRWFQQENPAFNPAALQRITFLFGRSEKGMVILDDLGFRS